MVQIKSIRLLKDEQFNRDTHLRENSLANLMLTQPHMITPYVNNLIGFDKMNYTLGQLTEGSGAIKEIPVDAHGEYYFDFKTDGTRSDQALGFADPSLSNADKPGAGHQEVEVKYRTNRIPGHFVIMNGSEKKLYVTEEPTEADDGWIYKLKVLSSDPSDYITEDDANSVWSIGYAPAAPKNSMGTYNRETQVPGKMRNRITRFRNSYRIGDNRAPEYRIRNFTLQAEDGREFNTWIDYELYINRMEMLRDIEIANVYGTWNTAKNGQTLLKASNNETIPTGAGLLEQVPNKMSRGDLSPTWLIDTLETLTFGKLDTGGSMDFVMTTGSGGMRDFAEIVELHFQNKGFVEVTDQYYQKGDVVDLYSKVRKYRTLNGSTITLIKDAVFDIGPVATAQRESGMVHYKTGFPIESHRMVFIDKTPQAGGEPNLFMVTEKGRYEEFGVVGSMFSKAPESMKLSLGDSFGKVAPTEVDAGMSIHYAKTVGICHLNPTYSLDIECSMLR